MDIEAHFNLWKLPNSKTRRSTQFMDIGLMIPQPHIASQLNIYMPLKSIKKVKDLGIYLEDTSTIQAVFNERWHSKPDPGTGNQTFKINDFEGNPMFQVYKISPKDFKIELLGGGSILQLAVDPNLDKKTYFRFRVIITSEWEVDKEEKLLNSWLESSFSATEILDFHVNEKRSLTEDVLNLIFKEGSVRFTKTHLFLMRSQSFDYVFSHPLPVDARTLESKIWTAYLGEDFSYNQLLSYHWRQKNEKAQVTPINEKAQATPNYESINIFAKLRIIRSGKLKIVIFLGVILLIGIIGNLAASWIWGWITN